MTKNTNYKKGFLDVFRKLSYCRSSWDIWNDFLSMGCISMSNSMRELFREDGKNNICQSSENIRKRSKNCFRSYSVFWF